MKKFSFLSALLMLLGLSATAEESISVSDVLVPKGGQAMMEVNFHFNTGHDYVSYQFTVNLPDGISLATDNYGTVPVTLGDGQPASIFKGLDLNATTHILTCYSNPSTPINGTDGVLVRIPIKADADKVDVGDVLTGSLTAVQFAHIDASGQDFGDASIKITIDDTSIYFDEDSENFPEYTVGKIYDITMKRTIKTNEWNSICLPFAMTGAEVTAIFGDDVLLADFVDYEMDDDATKLKVKFEKKDPTEGMEANYPYLIKINKPQNMTEFTAKAIVEPDEDGALVEYDNGKTGSRRKVYGTFKGTFHAQTIVPEKSLFLSGNKFYYSTGKTKMKAFRAYFDFVDLLAEVDDASARITMSFDDDATGISEAKRLSDNGAYYSLDGRKLDKRPVRKGVYIRNGKKNVVK